MMIDIFSYYPLHTLSFFYLDENAIFKTRCNSVMVISMV